MYICLVVRLIRPVVLLCPGAQKQEDGGWCGWEKVNGDIRTKKTRTRESKSGMEDEREREDALDMG